jgi:predicted enzyme related to lactoylglutathione lyase
VAIGGVANIWMPVEDTDRAVDFYRNKLGLSLVKRDGLWAEFESDGVRVGLNGRESRGARAEGGPVLTFHVEGRLEETVDALREKGVEISSEVSEHEWGRVVTFKDSEGNDLQLYEAPGG